MGDTAPGSRPGNPKEGEDAQVYDRVFQTVVAHMPELLIPLVNYTFHTHYPSQTPVVQVKNELRVMEHRRTADAVFLIDGVTYHFECESSGGGVWIMLQRMLEYDFAIALRSMREGVSVFQLPASCVLYLRHTRDTPDMLEIKLRNAEGDTMPYRARVLKVQQLSQEELFENGLLMFLPYYIMRYESRFDRLERDAQAREDFFSDLEHLCRRLWALEGHFDGKPIVRDVTALMKDVARKLLRSRPDLRKGVSQIMNENCFPLATHIMLEKGITIGREEGRKEGRKEGREEGREEGGVQNLAKLIGKGILSITDAASTLGMSVQEFIDKANQYGTPVRGVN